MMVSGSVGAAARIARAVNAGTRAGVALECACGGVGFMNGLICGVPLRQDFCFLQTIHIDQDSEKEAR
jgi:hypothetical protein